MENILLWEILVPSHSNDGKKYTLEHHRGWDKYVASVSGGLTIFETVKGKWQNITEGMIPVRIACTEQDIGNIMNFTLKYYNQIEVLAYEISSNVKLLRKS